jgi:hypothetical protein
MEKYYTKNRQKYNLGITLDSLIAVLALNKLFAVLFFDVPKIFFIIR